MRLIGAPPLTLADLIRKRPDIACRRQLGAAELRKLLEREKGECTWCGFGLSGRQITFCGKDCVLKFKEHCQPGYAARRVRRRDNGICQICGWTGSENHRSPVRFVRGNAFEVDHIVPVCEGGGLLGLANLRLVCGKCHLEVTNELAKRRKGKR